MCRTIPEFSCIERLCFTNALPGAEAGWPRDNKERRACGPNRSANPVDAGFARRRQDDGSRRDGTRFGSSPGQYYLGSVRITLPAATRRISDGFIRGPVIPRWQPRLISPENGRLVPTTSGWRTNSPAERLWFVLRRDGQPMPRAVVTVLDDSQNVAARRRLRI